MTQTVTSRSRVGLISWTCAGASIAYALAGGAAMNHSLVWPVAFLFWVNQLAWLMMPDRESWRKQAGIGMCLAAGVLLLFASYDVMNTSIAAYVIAVLLQCVAWLLPRPHAGDSFEAPMARPETARIAIGLFGLGWACFALSLALPVLRDHYSDWGDGPLRADPPPVPLLESMHAFGGCLTIPGTALFTASLLMIGYPKRRGTDGFAITFSIAGAITIGLAAMDGFNYVGAFCMSLGYFFVAAALGIDRQSDWRLVKKPTADHRETGTRGFEVLPISQSGSPEDSIRQP